MITYHMDLEGKTWIYNIGIKAKVQFKYHKKYMSHQIFMYDWESFILFLNYKVLIIQH